MECMRTINEPVEFSGSLGSKLFTNGATLRRLWTEGKWVEGPVWRPSEQCLLWSDIPNNRIMRWHATDGVRVWRKPSDFSNGNTLDHEGRLVTCEHGSRSVTRTELDGTRTTLASHYKGKRLNSPNDVVVKSDGSIWFTDPPYGILSNYEGYKANSELGANYVFRLDPGTRHLEVVADEFVKPNGLAFSPDERTLYISDTGRSHDPDGPHHVRAFDLVEGRSLTGGRVLAEIEPGVSDGFCVDVSGHIFTSAGDGVQVLTPEGTLIAKVRVPEIVSNCCFGGPHRDRLFITATTSLYAIQLATTGM